MRARSVKCLKNFATNLQLFAFGTLLLVVPETHNAGNLSVRAELCMYLTVACILL